MILLSKSPGICMNEKEKPVQWVPLDEHGNFPSRHIH